MKRLLRSVLAVALLTPALFVMAQETTVPRKPLIEVFTSSTCPPCVRGNVVVDGVLDQNPDAYSLIKYQMNWPGTGDPYYLDASAARRNYYSVSGVPSLKTNGTDAGYPGYWTQQMFDQLAGTTQMNISAQAAVTASPRSLKTGGLMLQCQIDIHALEAYGAGLRAYAMVVEQNTFGNATTNGETIFHHVVQGYLLPSEGQNLGSLAKDAVVSYDLELDLSGSNVETGNDLMVVVFVQHQTSKQVVQSEMVEVAHPFSDYTATFHFFDDDYNPIDGGKIMVELAGSGIIHESTALISKLLPGSYSYDVVVPGYLPYSGSITVEDQDIEESLFIEIPPFFFYEDFENAGIPDGWTVHNPQADYFDYYMGELVYQKMKDTEDAVYLTLPKLTLDQGCVFSVKAGQSQGRSHLGIGVTTDPNNPGGSYTELARHEIFSLENMKAFGARMDQTTLGDGYLCMKLTAEALNNFFYLDDAIVIENMPGYKVQFRVTDQDGAVLPEAVVSFLDESLNTNTFGYATWRDVDEADYAYSVSYRGEVIETGTLSVWEDMLKEVVHNTSGIELTEKESIGFYPNPAGGQIIVRGVTEGSVRIMNISGQTLIEHAIVSGNMISVRDLPQGVYLVKISTNKQEFVQKLLKR